MVTNISYFGTDSISLFLSSAVKNLRILHEAMESDLLAQQRSGISSGPEYLLDCCDAMTTVLQALDRITCVDTPYAGPWAASSMAAWS